MSGSYREAIDGGGGMGDASTTTTNGNSTMTTATTNSTRLPPSQPKMYPRNFFDVCSQKLTYEQKIAKAECLWKYRDDRPPDNGDEDMSRPDGKMMLKIIQRQKQDLRQWVKDQYTKDVLEKCHQHGVKDTSNQHAVLVNDVKDFLCTLEDTTRNHQLLWEIFFHFPSSWCARTVDSWLIKNNYVLKEFPKFDDKGQKIRHFHNDRGSHLKVAQEAKSQALRSYLDNLFKRQHWKIVTVRPKQDHRFTIETLTLPNNSRSLGHANAYIVRVKKVQSL